MPANPLSHSALTELSSLLVGQPGADPAAAGNEALAIEAITSERVGALNLRQLQDAAKLLGLTGHSRSKKDELVVAVWQAWHESLKESLRAAGTSGGDGPAPVADPGAAIAPVAHKFELQRTVPPSAVEIAGDIPWGYGRDRVTAMAIDPDRLFVYWEVLEASIARARAQLGDVGDGAWLNLRVLDVSGRIFDGGNEHGAFDQGIDRNARQWFFTIGKPTSEVIVEVGMRAANGAFVRIEISGRVEFPRRDPVPWSEPEWLTVRTAGTEVHHGWGARGAGRGAGGEGAAPTGGARNGVALPGAGPLAAQGDGDLADAPSLAWEAAVSHAHGGGHVIERTEWEEVRADGVPQAHRRVTWEEHSTISSWQEGPFPYPVEVPAPMRESFVGRTFVYRSGERTRVVYGPWQVVIRGVNATSTHTVLSQWEVYRSWGEEIGTEVVTLGEDSVKQGASERVPMGASERQWRGGSERRLGGASELYFVGASERRLMGSSELMYAGSSERLRRGASERRAGGASEQRLGGASEQRLVGASENSPRGTAGSAYPAPLEAKTGAVPSAKGDR